MKALKTVAVALGITLAVYAIVAVSALAAVGPDVLAHSAAPLATAVGAGDLDGLVPAVRIGGAIAAPFAGFLARLLPARLLTGIVGVVVIALAIYNFVQLR